MGEAGRELWQAVQRMRVYWAEIPIFFGGLWGLEFYLQQQSLSLMHLSPHPYWVGVLTFGVIYGMGPGFLAGALSAALLTDWGAIRQLDAMMLLPQMFTQFMLILGGLALGLVSTRWRLQLREYEQTTRELSQTLTTLEQDRERLISANLVLEKKVVSRQDTILTLYEAARNLGSLKRDELFENIPNLLISYLKAQSCSVYIMDNDQLVLLVQHHWPSERHYPSFYPRTHPLVRLIQQKRRILGVQELQGIDEAILVAPLITQDQLIYGMLKIEKMAFLDLTSASVKVLEMLADWIMRAVENAQSFGASKESQLRDELTGAYTFYFFKERLLQEIRLARRYRLDLTVAFIQILDFERMEPETQEKVLSIVFRVLNFQLRDDDLIARCDYSPSQFAVIFPFTNRQGGEVVIQRCLYEIIGYEFHPIEGEDSILLLAWDLVETADQSLLAHPAVIDLTTQVPDERTDEMVERLLGQE